MRNLRLSIHSAEHSWLRQLFLEQRQKLGLSQRALADKLGVIHSFIGKVETGDRRLDVFEFIAYCKGLELDPMVVLQEINQHFSDQ
ncbi:MULTISPECIES: helix-turn-helix domain-containing protein [unclassified Lonepinella]|uniref:helix-turn-helix domain-containing protein n=1 Tax=unclassified Lonepinella TaxID=2642006 RepID=UPI0036DD04CA